MAGGILGDRNGNGARSRYKPMSEINVTPMVDVMLVLLVIFMVAAPLLITVNAEGKLFLQNTAVGDDELVPRLQAITQNNPNADIYVRGDRAISYGRVMEVMGMVSAAGFTKVSLITEQAHDKTKH